MGRHRYYFPRGVWVVIIVSLSLSAWLYVTSPPLDNIMVPTLWVLAGLTALGWFLRHGRAPRRIKVWLVTLVVAVPLLWSTFFRLDSVTGDFAPIWVFRFAADGDTLPASPTGAAVGADLMTTTPWDFPQFLGPARDVSVSAVSLDRNWETTPPELVWRQPIGEGWSSFSVVNGYAVTMEQRGDREMVTCYDLDTGALVWSWSVANRYDTVMAGVGPRATPTVDEGLVYALTNNGILVALDGSTGTPVWKQDLIGRYVGSLGDDLDVLQYGRSHSPLILGTLVIVPAGGSEARGFVSLAAFDKKTGVPVWDGGDQPISMSSPTVATLAGVEQVLTVNADVVTGHDPTSGAVLWEFPWPSSGGFPHASQAVGVPPNRVWLSSGYGGGAVLLELTPSGGGRFRAEPVWQNARVLQTKFSQVTMQDGYAYGLSNGILECVEVATGQRVWKRGRYEHGQILRVHDLLIVLSEDGEVLLVEASPERPDNVLGRFQAIDGTTWNNFALYGPYLAVRNAREAAVFRLPVAAES